MKRLLTGATLAAFFICAAQAQTYRDAGGTVVPGSVPLVGCSASGECAGPASSTNPLPVSGTFSLSGFQPTPPYSQLSVGATSSRVALPSGTVVVVYNTGSNAAYVTLGGSSVAATTADDVIQPNSWMAFTVGSNAYLAAIETAGGTALNISGGSGLPTGAGGGGGGAITSPLGSSTPDSAGVAVTFAGTPPTGFSNPCAGAVGLQGELDCLVSVANSPALFPVNVAPTDCSVTLTTGGTAQNAFAAQTALHGFTIANIDASTGSGEPVWFSFTGTAAAGAAGSYPLAAPAATTYAGLTSYTTPAGFATSHALSVVAGTTGHKISCTWW